MDLDNKIDWFGPQVIMAFVAAAIGDLTFFFLITHYICGAIAIGAIGSKTKGIPAKLVLLLAWILPGPTLVIGLLLAILLSNRAIAFILEQVAIQAIAIGTGGTGEALEVGALGAEAAEAGVAVAEAGEAAAEAATAAAEVGEAAGAAAEAGEATAEAGEAAEGAEAGEGAESENKRPSEESTERENRRKSRRHGDQDQDDEDEETEAERRARLSNEEYQEAAGTGNEPEAIEQAEQNFFSEKGPTVRDVKPPQSSIRRIPKDNKGLRLVKKAQEKRSELQKSKQSQQATDDRGGDDSNYLKEAA